MRRLRESKYDGTSDWLISTPELSYARGKCAEWLLRLMDGGVALEDHFFGCLDWAAGSLRPIIQGLANEAESFPGKAVDKKCKKAISDALNAPEHRLDDELEELINAYPVLRASIVKQAREKCLAAISGAAGCGKVYHDARKKLKAVFGVSDNLYTLCEFAFIEQSYSSVENYLEDHLHLYKHPNRRILAHMLGMSCETLQTCHEEAYAFGFFESDSSYFRLADELLSFWENGSGRGRKNLFHKTLNDKPLSLDKFRLPQEDIDHVLALLSDVGDEPLHILLYGPPGMGKTTFAASLAAALNVRAWSVVSRQNDDEGDRRTSLRACLNMAAKHRGAFVLVDEAERLLDTNNRFVERSKDKAWLNAFLEEPGRRVIWVTNHIGHVDQSVLRRFAYSMHFDRLGGKERKEIWRQVLVDQRATKALSEQDMDDLARDYDVPVAVIEKAVRQAKRLKVKKKDFASTVERVLRAHLTLSNGGAKQRKGGKSGEEYVLDGVCMTGSAEDLLGQCRRVDAMLRDGRPVRPGGATMLFYGPPGTGKTALARHIAKELERECVVKRASDLLSMWVGGTEKNIADAFARAEEKGDVLVIDEADSFIYSRDIAQRSWETSQVNEFLTALEQCRGFCICTTNRRDNMDAAAMRRFSFKMEFTYAGPEQVKALYDALLAPLAASPLSRTEENSLLAMNRLTPGDFNAVKSQRWLDEPGTVPAAELVEALRREQDMKLDQQARRVGF